MPIFDQFSDPAFGVLVKQASRMPAFAEYVKEADIEAGEHATLPKTAFAWPEEKKFPVHTDKHAALSFAYAKAQPRVPTNIVNAIKEALEVYGIPETTFAEPATKVAAAEDFFLLPDLKLFPVRTKEDVKLAEQALLAGFKNLDLDHRAEACTKLATAASDYGVELHPAMLQFAGMVVSSTKIAAEWLHARAAATGSPILKAAYEKLAKEMVAQGPEIADRGTLVKVASTVAELDEKAGLVKHYDRKIPDALRTVFNTGKEAAASIDLNGTMVPLKKLAALPASFWSDLGGAELSREICPNGVCDPAKLATVVDTLPLDLKVVLRSQLGG